MPRNHFIFFVLLAVLISIHVTAADSPAIPDYPVTISIDASKTLGELRPIWRYFGYDEPNYTYMKDGRKLLSQIAEAMPYPAFIRTHNLLTSGDGTPALKWGSSNAYTLDPATGKPRYDWTILDRIFDTYHERHLKAYVQLGFMPKDLSSHPALYPTTIPTNKRGPFGGGWNAPPRDYDAWRDLVSAFVTHCIERYGKPEVESWYWELWNEPNLGMYFKGTPQDYQKLYDYTADGVKRALPTARVGGPEVAGPDVRYFKDFLTHCVNGPSAATGKPEIPLDFIAFHAKGAPKVIDGHVQMGIGTHLRNIDNGFAAVASFPQLKSKPIVIGESDPEGCAACPSTEFPQNAYRNGALYACYTAASFARKFDLAERHGVNFEGALTWAFEFENQPWFAGFRALATNGVELPVLNTFRMFGQLNGQRLAVTSTGDAGLDRILRQGIRGQPDVSALASLAPGKIAVLIWNYHDDDISGPTAAIDLTLTNLPASASPMALHHYRIDTEHSNSYEAWKRIGSPKDPTPDQVAQLESAARLSELNPPEAIAPKDGKLTISFKLPRQGVSLIVLTQKQ
jgi:xylan 1,4-beta-xylosidase